MSVRYLILKLDGVMQAWGGHTYEDFRPVEMFPTRSGLMGFLGACMGIDRNDGKSLGSLGDSVVLSIRAEDRTEGCQPERLTDFHTVIDARKVDGSVNKNPVVSKRQYWCDMVYTVAMRSTDNPEVTLDELAAAMCHPVYTPFLGRRSCPLSRPPFEGWIDADDALAALAKVVPNHGTVYTEEPGLRNAHVLRVRDVPMPGGGRAFATRTVYLYGGGENDVLV